MLPEISFDEAVSELEKWVDTPNPLIQLVEEFPGHMGTTSCLYNILLLEKAYCNLLN